MQECMIQPVQSAEIREEQAAGQETVLNGPGWVLVKTSEGGFRILLPENGKNGKENRDHSLCEERHETGGDDGSRIGSSDEKETAAKDAAGTDAGEGEPDEPGANQTVPDTSASGNEPAEPDEKQELMTDSAGDREPDNPVSDAGGQTDKESAGDENREEPEAGPEVEDAGTDPENGDSTVDVPEDAGPDNAGEEEGTEPDKQPAAEPEKPVTPDAEQPALPLEKPEGSATGCIRLPDTLFPSGEPVNADQQQPEITVPSVPEAGPAATVTPLLPPDAESWPDQPVRQPVVQTGPSLEAAFILNQERQTDSGRTLQPDRWAESASAAETAGPATDLSGTLAAAADKSGSEPVQVRAGSRLFSWNPQEGLKVMQDQQPAVPSRFTVVEDGQRVQLILPGPEPVLSAQVNGQTVPVQQRQEGSVIEVTRAYAGQQVRALTASGKVIEQQIAGRNTGGWLALWPALLAPVIWLRRRRHG